MEHDENKKILVIGDVMLDMYSIGKVNRISPEAPVPVFKENKEKNKYVPGGAANVAVNLIAAGVDASLFSIVGKDENGTKLVQKLVDWKVDTEYIYVDEERPTTTKLRYIGQNNQQILRVDVEAVDEINKDKLEEILKRLEINIKQYGLFLISDYKKGFITEEISQFIISLAQRHNIPILIDVKDTNIKKYSGATVLKPNKNELQLLTGRNIETEEDMILAARWLCNVAESKYVLTTLGDKGMLLVDKNGLISRISSVAQEVYDVTGAGDTTIAYLASEILRGKDIRNAMVIANYAAGIQVSKVGTSVVYPDEVKKAMQMQDGNILNKCLNMYEYHGLQEIEVLHGKNKKIVFTNGCFDILHAGHVDYLKKARNKGDILVVGINSDASVRRLKGDKRPINNIQDRCMILSALTFVDYVIPFEEDTPLELIMKVKPHVLVKGGDYTIDNIVGADFVKDHGGVVETISFVQGKSTTNIINKIKV